MSRTSPAALPRATRRRKQRSKSARPSGFTWMVSGRTDSQRRSRVPRWLTSMPDVLPALRRIDVKLDLIIGDVDEIKRILDRIEAAPRARRRGGAQVATPPARGWTRTQNCAL